MQTLGNKIFKSYFLEQNNPVESKSWEHLIFIDSTLLLSIPFYEDIPKIGNDTENLCLLLRISRHTDCDSGPEGTVCAFISDIRDFHGSF